MNIKNKLAKYQFVRRIFYLVGPASGDTIRMAIQKPLVLKYLNKKLNKTLEIGCGSGLYTPDIAKNSSGCVSVDIQLQNVISNKNKHRERQILWICADAQNLPLKNSIFDTVVCIEVLEHLGDDQKGISEIARVLKKNGKLILSVPVPPAPIKEEDVSRYGHKREGYKYSNLEKLLRENKFTIIKSDYCFLKFSRLVFKLLNWCDEHVKIKPPGFVVMFISKLDCLSKNKEDFQPYNVVIEAISGG